MAGARSVVIALLPARCRAIASAMFLFPSPAARIPTCSAASAPTYCASSSDSPPSTWREGGGTGRRWGGVLVYGARGKVTRTH